MSPSLRLHRLALRLASVGLRVVWRLARVRPDGVKCVVCDGETVLLVRHTYGPRVWDLPGGGGRRGEPAAVTARREMAEELGLEIDGWSDLGELRSVSGSHRVHVLGARLRAGGGLTVDAAEIAEARWWPRDRLPAPTGRLMRRILAEPAPRRFLTGP